MRERANRIAKRLPGAIVSLLLMLFTFLLTGLASAGMAILLIVPMSRVMSCNDGACFYIAQLVIFPVAWVTLLVLTWFSLRVYKRM